jgi:acetate kinase
VLNEQCGLLGVSGRSEDMRELLEAELAGDERAQLAIGMFCYRIRKYIGAYLAALGGADAIIFGGGIGENAADVRRRGCEGLQWAGLSLDLARNRDAVNAEARISVDGAPIEAYVIPVREERLIARETAALLGSRSTG